MRAVAESFKEVVRDFCKPFQIGVNEPGGCETLRRLVSTHASMSTLPGILALDSSNAFCSMDRGFALQAVSSADKNLVC